MRQPYYGEFGQVWVIWWKKGLSNVNSLLEPWICQRCLSLLSLDDSHCLAESSVDKSILRLAAHECRF
ncbi:hypothetical protein BKA60DRAFT_35128 [Fusarium oxysporum]|nr:hypothetical protein BKA60DRAFT_35128 [Fusarium oxysporum]